MGHLTKWLFFNLLFGAIPYTLVVALNQLQSPGSPLLHPSSEVLFIAVVATSSALGELWDQDGQWHRPPAPDRIHWQLAMLVGVLSSSLLYGAYVYATLGNPGRPHGVDCSALVAWAANAGPQDPWRRQMVVQWGSACTPWVRSQALFFHVSLVLTLACAAGSTAAMYRFPPKRW
ncbi:MAG TPA: hypothetical protein VLK84_01190 [Longimicrobium sp.]|nr:hypothetical protein [Longimicrobium sp.]